MNHEAGWPFATSPQIARGFTLVELLVAIAVLGILSSVALPGFRDMILNSARTSSLNTLVSALQLARSEALQQRREVTVCPSASLEGGCLDQGHSAWEQGILIFIDSDGDGQPGPRTDSRGRPLLDSDGRPLEDTVILHSGPLHTSTRIVSEAPRLKFRAFNQPSSNRSLFICDQRGVEQARAVITNRYGRVRSASPDTDPELAWTCPA